MLVAVASVACKGTSEDELKGNWTRRGDFSGGPRGHAAIFTIGNKAYVCCGYNGNRLRLNDVYEYDNETATWRPMTSFPGGAREQAVAFSINGKGYVGTGWDGKENVMRDFWEFDPNAGDLDSEGKTKGTWKEVASLPADAAERYGAVAFSLPVGGKTYGYVGTGYMGNQYKNTLKDFWRYDAETDAWEHVPDYDGSKRYGATVFVIDDKAYLSAGISFSGGAISDMWMFAPNSPSLWTKKNPTASVNDASFDDDYGDIPRSYAASFAIKGSDGITKGYLAGGSGKSTVWEYNPVEDLWIQRTGFYNSNVSQIRMGAVAFSFPDTNQGFFGMGVNNSMAYEDLREFHPEAEDDLIDD